MSENSLTSELVKTVVERLNTLTTTSPGIEFVFVISSAGDMIACSSLLKDEFDWKVIASGLAEMAVTSVELVRRLGVEELPPKERFYKHTLFLKSQNGYVVVMPINNHFWLVSVARLMAMLGVVQLDSFRACDDIDKLLSSTPEGHH